MNIDNNIKRRVKKSKAVKIMKSALVCHAHSVDTA